MVSNKKIFMRISLREWSLDDPLPTKRDAKLRIEKRGMKLKKIFSSEITKTISTKLC
jgi:hypothetical protein